MLAISALQRFVSTAKFGFLRSSAAKGYALCIPALGYVGFLILVTIPFWSNYLLRGDAGKLILGYNGALNSSLLSQADIAARLRGSRTTVRRYLAQAADTQPALFDYLDAGKAP